MRITKQYLTYVLCNLKNIFAILELSTLQKEVSSLPLLSVAAYWKSLRQQPVSDTCKQH